VPGLSLVLVLHAHRAHGSPEADVAGAARDAYGPLVDWLERHPFLRAALHVSGPLLDRLDATHRGLVDRVAALVARGQVEPWGGGIGEPLLAALPPGERRAQIEAMADRVEARLGVRPRGAWLARGAWEPSLAHDLPEAGVGVVALDDARLASAGVGAAGLWAWHRTEHAGRTLALLPARRALRDLVRAGDAEGAVAWLFRGASAGGALAVLAERVERWSRGPGGAPGAWASGALDRLAEAIAANAWIAPRTPAEALAAHPCAGLAWPAPGTGAWALPPAARARRREARTLLEARFGEEADALLAPASPLQPFARFPEANRLHRRVLAASRRLEADPRRHGPEGRAARVRLWRAQGADVLGPAPSGGIHRPLLRAAAWADLIAAERLLAPPEPRVEVADLDLDGEEDARVETPRWAAWIGARGGGLWGFDDRDRRWNVRDTIAPHDECAGAGAAPPEPSGAFLDAWVEAGERRLWAADRFGLVAEPPRVRLAAPEGPGPALEKRFGPGADGAFEALYVLASERPRLGRLDVRVDLGVHAHEAPGCWVEVDGAAARPPHAGAAGRHEGVTRFAWVDLEADRRVDLWTDRPAALARAPIRSRCAGPAGPETVMQGLSLRFSFAVALEAGKPWRVRFRLAPGGARQPA